MRHKPDIMTILGVLLVFGIIFSCTKGQFGVSQQALVKQNSATITEIPSLVDAEQQKPVKNPLKETNPLIEDDSLLVSKD